jgi:putative membrane protein
MSWLISTLIVLVITAISLIIISKISFIGVEIDSLGKAIISAIVIGILNALAAPFNFITFGLLSFVINIIVFGLAAWLVPGFRLRNKIWSAVMGAIALSIINYLIFYILSQVGISVA